MSGSLTYLKGVLYIGTEEITAHIRSFDLDGRELDAGFSFRSPENDAASVDGLDIDDDHRLWIADGTAGRLCAYTLFGEEVAGVQSFESGKHDKGGVLGRVSDVVSFGSDDAQELIVTSAGRRRHALQRLQLGDGRTQSLRSMGRIDRAFQDLRGVFRRDEYIWACERGAGLIQIFRDGDFHNSFGLGGTPDSEFRPNAIEALEDGRMVVATGGEASALCLLDRRGRLMRVIAEAGHDEGQVTEPSDLVLVEGVDDAHTRVVAIDSEGTRVQVFTITGNCHGTFPGFAGSERSWSPE